MYIKSLTLRGFLCYKDVTTVNFDPNLTSIVGPNGSGKSSLLKGLKFAMGATNVDKSRLLHQGTSSRVFSGYVSLVLDNSDHRLTGVAQDDVVLRRDFGPQRDELTLNGKKITKAELTNLLECAGFSRTNPYYFVHQHEVAMLTGMSNAERLTLLKEVAGTRVYDDRRCEAAKSVEESLSKQKAINSTLDVINTRLQELKEERNEFNQFLEVEREVLDTESVLAEKELARVEEKIVELQAKEQETRAFESSTSEELREVQEQIELRSENRYRHELDLKVVTTAIEHLRENKVAVTKEATRVNLLLEELAKHIKESRTNCKRKKEELSQIGNQIESVKQLVAKLQPEVSDTESNYAAVKEKLILSRQEIVQLSAKLKTRNVHGKRRAVSAAERQSEISNEIQSKEQQLEAQLSQRDRLREEADILNGEIESNSSQLAGTLEATTASKEALETTRQQIIQQRKTHDEMWRQRQQVGAEIRSLQQTLVQLEESLRQATRKLSQTCRPAQLAANCYAMQLAAEDPEFGGGKVLGTLGSLIRVEPQHFTAVETTAKGQLFNLLVRERAVTIKLIKKIKKGRVGSTTLTPLQDIKTRESIPEYPSDPDAIPLVKVIQCDEEVQPAVQQVFGRYLLVKNSDAGRKYLGSRFDCVTVDGDIISRHGVLTGGYRGNQIRLAIQASIFDLKSQIETAKGELESKMQQSTHLVDEMKDCDLQLSNIVAKNEAVWVEHSDLTSKLEQIERNGALLKARLAHCKKAEDDANSQVDVLKESISRLRREGSNPAEDEAQLLLHDAEARTMELEAETEEMNRRVSRLRAELDSHQALLDAELLPRHRELKAEIAKLQTVIETGGNNENSKSGPDPTLEGQKAVLDRQLSLVTKELKSFSSQRSSLLLSLTKEDEALKNLNANLENLTQRLGGTALERETISSKLTTLGAERDALAVKQSATANRVQHHRAADCQSDSSQRVSVERLRQMTSQALLKHLATVSKKLQQFGDINRKALDQYSIFCDETELLMVQRQRLSDSEERIRHLMRSLDEQKDATLLQTFENVNQHFSEVFSEIVQDGRAKLVLKRMSDEQIACLGQLPAGESPLPENARHPDAENLWEDTSGTRALPGGAAPGQEPAKDKRISRVMDALTGVAIKVRFPSTRAFMPLESLSGGQKSVVALALMFALQRVDAAPIYVLDEVDASLDVQYRGAVASLIKKQSRKNQLIIISHKPETVQGADRFLKLSQVNQSTHVSDVRLEEALELHRTAAATDASAAPGLPM